jgi:hypothetical protein
MALRVIAIHAVLALVNPRPSPAGFVTNLSADAQDLGAGLYSYTYTLTDLPGSTISAYVFALAVDANADLQSLTAPSGWEVLYTPGSSTVEWDTAFLPLGPGDSANFSFTSALAPGINSYQATGFDPDAFQFYFNNGMTISPSPLSVPEPISWVMFATGLGFVVVFGATSRLAGKRVWSRSRFESEPGRVTQIAVRKAVQKPEAGDPVESNWTSGDSCHADEAIEM